MPVILSIDTSTQACSCAISRDGQVDEIFEIIPRQHASRLLPMIDSLMKRQSLDFGSLDAVAYGRGPGSFTGLRIAAGVTQGIALGANLPVIPVSSLASLALLVSEELEAPLFFSTLDARIDEVYWGFYRAGEMGVELVGDEGLCKPEMLPVSIPGNPVSIVGAGSGMEFLERMPDIYKELIDVNRSDIFPRAGAIAKLAAGYLQCGMIQSADDVNPAYLRDKVTHA